MPLRGAWKVGDIRPYGFCLKFGGGSFTFADNPRELEKGSESAGACVSQCISCGLPLVYTSHMLPYAALGSPSHLPPDIRPYGFCLKFGGGSFTFADNPRELEKGSESAGACVSQCIYIMYYIDICNIPLFKQASACQPPTREICCIGPGIVDSWEKELYIMLDIMCIYIYI